MTPPLVIALDGPAASGKGTLARALAAHFGLPHLDTGLLYRAVGAAALEKAVSFEDVEALAGLAARLDIAGLDAEALRAGPVGEAASKVAAIPQVRAKLLTLQQDFARQPGGAVLDGRDIGTVIAPEAPVKFFVTATPEARAARRHAELRGRGETIDFADVLADIERRDARDSGRASAPLKAAPDAVTLDNTHLGPEQCFFAALAILADRLPDPD
ncbi:(d)CMP kinase [Ancylobacter terrae]|uniref:(d)CMP kinase n=1 Tax=Ancylobacter sp. sgz301288 TaxID=3342077 RepID=UPI00385EBF0A